MPVQLGAHNPRLRAALALQTAKGRKEQGAFLFEGPTLLGEALQSPLTITDIFATPQAYENEAILHGLPEAQIALVDERTLAKLSSLSTPSGIVVRARQPQYAQAAIIEADGGLLLLAGLNDPGNVGTLMRSAEAFGIRGVLILAGTADPYNAKVVRAAMGSLFRLPHCIVAHEDIAALARVRPLIVAERGGTPLPQAALPAHAVLAIGHERHGVTLGAIEPALRIEIPHQGLTESLNAGIAGSILMYIFSCK